MRGFVVLFNTQPEVPRTQDDSLEQRFAQWKAGFGPTRLQRLDHSNCRLCLFTTNEAIPAEFNQRAWRTPTELLLWTGPRVDMTAADLLQAPISHDLIDVGAATAPGRLAALRAPHPATHTPQGISESPRTHPAGEDDEVWRSHANRRQAAPDTPLGSPRTASSSG